jgi:hypothetical protein
MWRQLINYFYNKQLFWKTKQWVDQKVVFVIFSNFHLIRNRFQEEKNTATILRYTIGGTLSTLLYSSIFILVLELLSIKFAPIFFTLFDYGFPNTIGEDPIGLLLSTIVTVNGVFLGLYFTALSAVAGNMFVKAPESLQQLFLKERQGKQYVDTVVATTVIGIFYLLARVFGYETSRLSILLLSILAVYAIARFISLGAKAFNFIHPVEASLTINNIAVNAMDNVMVSQIGWKKDYLQDHYRKEALRALNTLRDLVVFSFKEIKPSRQQYVDIVRNTANLLGYLITRKKTIPSESLWFTTQYKHQNWLLADSSEVTVALNTGTSLNPKSSKDTYWFERECIKIILMIFDHLIKQKEWEAACSCLEVIVWIGELTGKDFYYDVAQLLVDSVQDSFSKFVRDTNLPTDENSKADYLAIIDTFGRIPIGISLGLLLYIDKKTPEIIDQEIQQVDWLKDRSIYTQGLPGKLLADIENTSKNYRIEHKIEGKQISPAWYLTTITVQRYLFHLEKYYRYVLELNSKFFEINAEQLKAKKEYISASQLCDRWLEFSHKNLRMGWKTMKLITDCGSFKMVQDLPWTTLNEIQEEKIVKQYNKAANDHMVALLPIISALPKESMEGLPDYFGKAFIFGVMAAYEASLDNDHERLQKIYPVVFIGALSAYQNLLREQEGWTIESKIIFSSEPLEDLLTLSGFIKIYSELFENPQLWEVCHKVWDAYLQQIDPQPFLKQLAAISNYREAKPYLMPRAIIRTNWDMQLNAKLQELGLSTDIFSTQFSDDEDVPYHNSPVIRVVSKSLGLLASDTKEVFFATYLSKHPAAAGINFPDRWSISKKIEREENLIRVTRQ